MANYFFKEKPKKKKKSLKSNWLLYIKILKKERKQAKNKINPRRVAKKKISVQLVV